MQLLFIQRRQSPRHRLRVEVTTTNKSPAHSMTAEALRRIQHQHCCSETLEVTRWKKLVPPFRSRLADLTSRSCPLKINYVFGQWIKPFPSSLLVSIIGYKNVNASFGNSFRWILLALFLFSDDFTLDLLWFSF